MVWGFFFSQNHDDRRRVQNLFGIRHTNATQNLESDVPQVPEVPHVPFDKTLTK